MERYRQVLKKSYLPYIILIPFTILVIVYCIIEIKSVGQDLDTLFLECFFWGLLLLTAFLTWLNFFIYSRRLKRIKEELPDIKEQLENCSLSFNDTHFFLNEYFVSFEIPMAVRYAPQMAYCRKFIPINLAVSVLFCIKMNFERLNHTNLRNILGFSLSLRDYLLRCFTTR